MSWVGALLLLIGFSRAVPAVAALRRAVRVHAPNLFDWSWVAFFWAAWTALGLVLTFEGFAARWLEIALIALVGIHLVLSLRWRLRQSRHNAG